MLLLLRVGEVSVVDVKSQGRGRMDIQMLVKPGVMTQAVVMMMEGLPHGGSSSSSSNADSPTARLAGQGWETARLQSCSGRIGGPDDDCGLRITVQYPMAVYPVIVCGGGWAQRLSLTARERWSNIGIFDLRLILGG
jgi:hypothetical protein